MFFFWNYMPNLQGAYVSLINSLNCLLHNVKFYLNSYFQSPRKHRAECKDFHLDNLRYYVASVFRKDESKSKIRNNDH